MGCAELAVVDAAGAGVWFAVISCYLSGATILRHGRRVDASRTMQP
jgi:hypothetical protein